jgi:hypothetical protein
VACDWRAPRENALPPNPAGVDELGLRVNAAVLSGKLSWSDVAFSIGAPVGCLADLFQGRSPDDPDMKILLEAILDDCGG